MLEQEVFDLAVARGAVLLDQHIISTAGLHLTEYVDFRIFWKQPELAADLRRLCDALAAKFVTFPHVEAVVGPETGGAIIARGVASRLSEMHRHYVKPIVAFKRKDVPGKDFFIGEEDRAFLHSKRVLVVDDVLTSGSSLLPVLDRVRLCFGYVVGIGLLGNRSALGANDFTHSTLLPKSKHEAPKLDWLVRFNFAGRTYEECMQSGPCSRGVPVHPTLGHPDKLLEQRAAARG